MREKTCCFTGHREMNEYEKMQAKHRLEKVIEELIRRGVVYFGSGGAIGFDTLAALTVLKMKENYPQIRLIMVYPCENQTEYWKKEDVEVYESIKKACDKYVYVSKKYSKACMQKRNRHLVDCSSYCICFLKNKKGGTSYTVDYALKNGLTVINVADKN